MGFPEYKITWDRSEVSLIGIVFLVSEEKFYEAFGPRGQEGRGVWCIVAAAGVMGSDGRRGKWGKVRKIEEECTYMNE